jgi:hypothetical protein
MPLVSSSFDPRGVEVYRKRLFNTLAAEHGKVDLQLLLDFHASHAPTPSAYSPCMHREGALTVSFSRVTVLDSLIKFNYSPVAPCASRNRDRSVDSRAGWKIVHMQSSPQKHAGADCMSPQR